MEHPFFVACAVAAPFLGFIFILLFCERIFTGTSGRRMTWQSHGVLMVVLTTAAVLRNVLMKTLVGLLQPTTANDFKSKSRRGQSKALDVATWLWEVEVMELWDVFFPTTLWESVVVPFVKTIVLRVAPVVLVHLPFVSYLALVWNCRNGVIAIKSPVLKFLVVEFALFLFLAVQAFVGVLYRRILGVEVLPKVIKSWAVSARVHFIKVPFMLLALHILGLVWFSGGEPFWILNSCGRHMVDAALCWIASFLLIRTWIFARNSVVLRSSILLHGAIWLSHRIEYRLMAPLTYVMCGAMLILIHLALKPLEGTPIRYPNHLRALGGLSRLPHTSMRIALGAIAANVAVLFFLHAGDDWMKAPLVLLAAFACAVTSVFMLALPSSGPVVAMMYYLDFGLLDAIESNPYTTLAILSGAAGLRLSFFDWTLLQIPPNQTMVAKTFEMDFLRSIKRFMLGCPTEFSSIRYALAVYVAMVFVSIFVKAIVWKVCQVQTKMSAYKAARVLMAVRKYRRSEMGELGVLHRDVFEVIASTMYKSRSAPGWVRPVMVEGNLY